MRKIKLKISEEPNLLAPKLDLAKEEIYEFAPGTVAETINSPLYKKDSTDFEQLYFVPAGHQFDLKMAIYWGPGQNGKERFMLQIAGKLAFFDLYVENAEADNLGQTKKIIAGYIFPEKKSESQKSIVEKVALNN